MRETTATPAWKKPPQVRLSLGSLSLSDEILADRDLFVSADRRQAEAADREGLAVVDLSVIGESTAPPPARKQ